MTKLQELILKSNQLREANKTAFGQYPDVAGIPADVLEAIKSRNDEITTTDAEVKRLTDLEEMKGKAASFTHQVSTDTKSETAKPKVEYVRYSTVKNFKGQNADEKAYRFGKWFSASVVGDERSKQFCRDNGIEIKAQSEGTNTAGGYLVPVEFSNDIIDLREQYGVFRRNTRVVPMMSDTKLVPRRSSGLTVYYPGEGGTITESNKAWDQVSLVAKKYACLTLYSSELNEDAMISMGDDLAGEIGYAFALAEDQNAFNGDGTSTYAGTTGIRQRITDVFSTTDGKGQMVADGNAYSEILLSDFHGTVGKLPLYARAGAKWYCSSLFHETVMGKLQTAAGGNVVIDLANGSTPRFLGYPVELTQVMPVAAANSQVACIFGNLRLGSMLGDRRQLTLALSSDYKFAEDQLAIRGTQRVDINIHDVGSSTAAGPIVALTMKAS